MKTVLGIALSVVGGVLVLALLPFLAHAVVNAVFVLVLEEPVPGWWWHLIAPIQNLVVLPILAFAFVIKMGQTLSLVLPVVIELVVVGIGVLLVAIGTRIVRRERVARIERGLRHVRRPAA